MNCALWMGMGIGMETVVIFVKVEWLPSLGMIYGGGGGGGSGLLGISLVDSFLQQFVSFLDRMLFVADLLYGMMIMILVLYSYCMWRFCFCLVPR